MRVTMYGGVAAPLIGASWPALLMVASVAAGCGDDSSRDGERLVLEAEVVEQEAAEQEAFFDLARRVEVEVELDPADWAALRQEGRGLIAAFTGQAAAYDYSYFTATVTVDGQRYENAEVRKKGFIGSLSADRPSIKVNFERNVPGQTHLGLRRLTLNNDRQDPSHTHQCLAYELFAAAGVPASRCNIAHVVVNGEDLGTYSNVEPIKKPMLARHFADDGGNLYEGQIADFAADQIDVFQLKTNELENDRSDLQRVVDALDGDDAGLVQRLEQAVDLDAFRSFWATETLLGHWDGYAGNRNNFYLYSDPATDRLVFLPWGTDAAFEVANPFDPVNTNVSLYAAGRLANRLYSLPDQRQAYRDRMSELLSEVWDEASLLAEVDQIEALTINANPAALGAQRQLIASHPGALRAALEAPAPEWIDLGGGVAPAAGCAGAPTAIGGDFVTTWGSLDAPTPGVGQFAVQAEFDGAPFEANWFGGAGFDAAAGDGIPRLSFLSLLSGGRVLVVQLQVSARTFGPGVTPLHGIETVGFVGVVEAGGFRLAGFVGDGDVTFDAADIQAGQPVSGSFTGQLLQVGCLGL